MAGETLLVYEALTGPDTEAALEAVRDKVPDDVLIGLVTGNWIRLGSNRGPVRLDRGRSQDLAIGLTNETTARTMASVFTEAIVLYY